MARYSGARWMPIPENSTQARITPTQFILHSIIAPWTEDRVREYWMQSGVNTESHFGLDYDGSMGQFLDTNVRADANVSANTRAISIETASNTKGTDKWTAAQVTELVKLMVWAHKTHGIPARICRTETDPGFGIHRMFRGWSGGGTACPGDARAKQFTDEVFPKFLAALKPAEPKPPTTPTPSPTGTHKVVSGDTLWALARKYKVTVAQLKTWNGLKSDDLSIGQVLKVVAPAPTYKINGTWLWFENVAPDTGKTNSTLMVQQALKYEFPDFDYSSGPGIFGPKTREYYAKWQRRLGYTGDAADGLPGRSSLEALAKKYKFDVRYKGETAPSRVASPVPGKSVTYAYGVKNSRYAAGYHTGDDYAASSGTPVVAVRAGTIQWSNGNGGAYGNWIGLKADNGRVYVYCHLSTRSVSVGQKVSAGQQLGKVGATGNVTGPHLHFEDHPAGGFVYGQCRKPTW